MSYIGSKFFIPEGTAWVDDIKQITAKEIRLGDNSGFMAIKLKTYTLVIELAWCGKQVYCGHLLDESNLKVAYKEDYRISNVKKHLLELFKNLDN